MRLIARCCYVFSTFTCLKFCSVAGVAWATVLAAAMLLTAATLLSDA